MKNYTMEQVAELMKNKQPIDMKRVSLETLNPTAYKYSKDMEKAEKYAREMWLKVMGGTATKEELEVYKITLECSNLALQGLDFAKNSKEGVLFNFQQVEQRFKQYNAQLEEQKKKS